MNSNERGVYSGIVWAFAERFSSQLVSIIVAIVLARFLAPEYFGAVAIVTVIIAICNVFVTGGFGNALIQKKDVDELDYSTILIFSFAFSLFIYLLAFFSAKPIADFYKMPELVPVIQLMALRLPVAGINSVQHAYVSREMKFKLLFFVTSIGVVISGAVGILMAIFGYGIYSLVGQFLLSMILDTIILAVVLKKKVKLHFSFERLKKLFPFGFSVMLSELAGSLGDNIRTIVVGKGFSPAQLAFYGKANQFACVVVSNVNTALGKVLFPALAKEQEHEEEVAMLSKRILQTSLYLLTPLLVLLTFCADPIVKVLYNDQWYEMIPYIQVLALSYAFVPIHTTSLQRIKANGMGKEYLMIQVLKITIGLGLMFASVVLYDDAIYVAYSYLISCFINTIIHFVANKNYFGQSIFSQLKDISKIININILMAIALFLAFPLDKWPWVSLIVKSFLGISIYAILSNHIKYPIYCQLRNIALKKLKITKK